MFVSVFVSVCACECACAVRELAKGIFTKILTVTFCMVGLLIFFFFSMCVLILYHDHEKNTSFILENVF